MTLRLSHSVPMVLAAAGRSSALLLSVAGLLACQPLDTQALGALVPPTAAEDPALPQLQVEVAAARRSLHLQTFGDPRNPAALILPGGPGADFRLLLPLRALAERYHVVMWDPRGAGLSERVPQEELALDSFMDEIEAVRTAVVPGQKVVLMGHSHGGLLALRYTATHPELVEQLVLIEPGPITPEGRRNYRGGSVSFKGGQDFFWQNELLSSRDHAEADYKAVSVLPVASRNFYCPGEEPGEYPLWRFGTFHHHTVMHEVRAVTDSLNWAEGIETFAPEILIVAGSCGEAGAGFQEAYNLGALPRVRLVSIPGAGHITLFLEHAEALLEALRAHLHAYP